MKRISLIFLSSILLFSCPKDQKKNENDNGFSFGSPLSTNRALTSEEQSTATEICRLLREKREYFEILEDNRWEFNFDGEEKECGNRTLPKRSYITRLRVPSTGPVHFESRTRRYMDEILTDVHGFVSHFCRDLLNGTNTNIIQDVGGKKVQLRVGKSGAFYTAEAGWYYPENGNYKAYLLDRVSIYSKNATRNQRYYGVIKDRIKYRPCDDRTIKYMRQSLR